MTPLLETKNLSVEIAGKQICHQLNLQVQPGQRWGILGMNGIGKTTLLHTLCGLYTNYTGEIHIAGKLISKIPPKQRALHLGLLLQHTRYIFPASVFQIALTGRHPHLHNKMWETQQDYKITQQVLIKTQLDKIASRQVQYLSGGEHQRLAIATLLIQAPSLYLLDEPVTHLDIDQQIRMMSLFQEKANQQKSYLAILHDINVALQFCDHLMLLYGHGKVMIGETHQVANKENLQTLYQHPLEKITLASGEQRYLP